MCGGKATNAILPLDMDVSAYLDRIDYRGPLNPDLATLTALHVAHLRSVPFENLSIHAGEPIVLNDEALFDKIVRRRRGGFCYELNGLFSALLRSLGFKVGMLSAQVAKNDGGFSADFDHMALVVNLEQEWLADVGFGDSFIEPLPIDTNQSQIQAKRTFRIDRDGDYLVMLRTEPGSDVWEPQYRFTRRTYQYADYDDQCRYHQTSPESHFTQNRICSMVTERGRISVSDTRFIVSEEGLRRERAVTGQQDYQQLLREHFGIVM